MSDPRRNELESNREIRYDAPGAARMWDYWMGGKDNYKVDREFGDATLQLYDMKVMAKQSRQFLIRVVRYLTGEAGIRQFLDIGTGLPTMQNTHEVAQSIAPESRIVYVDNDPIVLAHARALLTNTTPEGVTDYLDADYHNPDLIISDAHNILNFNQPIAVMFMGSLGYARSVETATSVVARVMDAVPSGSYLVHWEGNDLNPGLKELADLYKSSGAVPYTMQPIDAIRQRFEGLDMVEPGLVTLPEWRPEPTQVGQVTPLEETTGGVGRKP